MDRGAPGANRNLRDAPNGGQGRERPNPCSCYCDAPVAPSSSFRGRPSGKKRIGAIVHGPQSERSPRVPDEGRTTAPEIEAIRGFAEASATAMAVVAGPAHRILYANPAFCGAAGRPADALVGIPAAEAFPRLAANVAALDRARLAGAWPRVWRALPLDLRPDEGGGPRFWDVEASPLRNGAGVLVGLLLQVRDVSAQRRAEAALEEALEAQHAIARTAEHRIKNSLQLVASLLRLQAAQVAEPAGRAAVEAATARVLAVAEAHRALQRSPDLSSVRLSDLLEELAAGTAVQHPGTDLRTDAEEGLCLDAERAIPLALVLAELTVCSTVRSVTSRMPVTERLSSSATWLCCSAATAICVLLSRICATASAMASRAWAASWASRTQSSALSELSCMNSTASRVIDCSPVIIWVISSVES